MDFPSRKMCPGQWRVLLRSQLVMTAKVRCIFIVCSCCHYLKNASRMDRISGFLWITVTSFITSYSMHLRRDHFQHWLRIKTWNLNSFLSFLPTSTWIHACLIKPMVYLVNSFIKACANNQILRNRKISIYRYTFKCIEWLKIIN